MYRSADNVLGRNCSSAIWGCALPAMSSMYTALYECTLYIHTAPRYIFLQRSFIPPLSLSLCRIRVRVSFKARGQCTLQKVQTGETTNKRRGGRASNEVSLSLYSPPPPTTLRVQISDEAAARFFFHFCLFRKLSTHATIPACLGCIRRDYFSSFFSLFHVKDSISRKISL